MMKTILKVSFSSSLVILIINLYKFFNIDNLLLTLALSLIVSLTFFLTTGLLNGIIYLLLFEKGYKNDKDRQD